MAEHHKEGHHPTHHKKKDDEGIPEGKMMLFWIAGAIAIYAGSWIAGHLEQGLGVSPFMFFLTGFFAFLLILFGGLAWIGVAVGVAQK